MLLLRVKRKFRENSQSRNWRYNCSGTFNDYYSDTFSNHPEFYFHAQHLHKQGLSVFFFSKHKLTSLLFFVRVKKIVTNFPSTRLVDENIKANTGQKSCWACEVREKEKGLTQLLS